MPWVGAGQGVKLSGLRQQFAGHKRRDEVFRVWGDGSVRAGEKC